MVAAVGLLAVACGSGSGSSSPQSVDPNASHAPVTISMWSEWTSKSEIAVFNKVFDMFHEQYPWITVDSRTGLTDNKITAAINAGDAPDTVLSFGVDNVGLWCSTGAWIDMTPYINGPDGIDATSTFPPSALTYTSYNGNRGRDLRSAEDDRRVAG
jgi:multiple sugar transport system substrate-binding protein